MAKPPTPQQQAAQIVHAQYVPIDYALAQQRAQDAKAQAALQAAGHALIAQLQGGIKPAGQAYDAAVNQQQALAQGGASLLASLNPNAQIQQNLAAVNAPPEQRAQLAAQTQAQFPGQGGVLNIEQGTIPGASLVAQKAAAQQFLAGLPTLAGLSQQRSAQGLAALANQNRNTLYGQRLSAAAQIPQLALNIGNTRAQQQAAAASFAAEQAYRQQENALRQYSIDSANARAQRSLQQRSKSASTRGVTTKAFGNTLYRVNPDGTLTTLAKKPGASTDPTAGLTPTKVQSYRGDAAAIASAARRGLPAQGTPGTSSFKKALPPITYNQAIREMEKHGVPLVIAVQALNRVYPSQYRITVGKKGNPAGLKQTGIKQGLK